MFTILKHVSLCFQMAEYKRKLRIDPAKPVRFITMSEALENVSYAIDHVALLPPASGDQDVVSEEEEENDIFVEPAGEVEMFESLSEDEEEKEYKSNKRWTKNSSAFQGMSEAESAVNMEEKYPLMVDKTPNEIWRLYFNEKIIKLIIERSLLYARRDKSDMNFQLSYEKLLNFLGIVLLSGYHSVPSETDFWSNQPDLHVEIVSQTMSRDAFQQIKKYIHLADNQNLTHGDKAAKVNGLYKELNSALQQFGAFHHYLSIDESMVPYHGRSSMKMFMKGKPIRFGYKIWVLAGADGYPYSLSIYQGKEINQSSEPLGTRVVKMLLNDVEQISDPSNHHVFMDNFFTSYDLLSDLRKFHFKATGTMRQNRTGGAAKLMSTDKEMKKVDEDHLITEQTATFL